ncbi:hypothetical protein QQX98_010431 [Neonectria punicea]|uniref:Uncharacterized protein n=1 Tax=Neonectria punicea TaxID=979145 RepID=A0ABR1GPU2_9HYPO
MKTAQASLALISGLMAAVAADALPPEDIPLQCITICGPIVELTTDCNVHYRRLKKRNLDDLARPEWVPKLAVEPPEGEAPLQARGEAVESFEKRSFSVIVAAPTSFPFALTASTVLNLRPTSTLTRINPVVEQSSSSSTLPKRTTTSNQASTTTTTISFTTSIFNSAASKSISDDSQSPTTSSWGWDNDLQEPQGKLYSQDSAEEDCVCLNESFDVAKVAALCASCIAVAGYPDNNINVIMEGCNFTALTYTPSLDGVANNIRVEAEWPTSATTSSAAGVRPASVGVAFAVVGFVVATAVML